MLNPCAGTAAAPLEGFLSYVPEAQEIRDAALAAFAPVMTAASWPPEAHQEAESGRMLLGVSSRESDDLPLAVTASPQREAPIRPAPRATRRIKRAAGAKTAGADCAPDSTAPLAELERAQHDVLAHARLLVVRDQQQQEARAAACRAEEAWVRTRYSATATPEQVKAANRARLAARRAFAKAWEAYVAASQVLCRSATSMIEQEGPV
jgi:hypothetical protein